VLLPSKAVVDSAVIRFRWGDLGVALACAVTSVVLTGLVFESVTDRDWSVRGWEWPQVMVAASVATVGALWLVFPQRATLSVESGSFVRRLVKSEFKRLGYTVQRLPSPAFDPQFALQIDFDYVLEHYLASRTDPRPFLFLQVGAYDGLSDDPLHRRVREGNWQGMLVEPQPWPFKRLMENYAGLDGLIFIQAAISEQPGQRRMFVIQDETGAPIGSLGGLASFRDAPLRAFHAKMASQYPGSSIGSIEVMCTTFDDVLAGTSYLDLLQIDVEGYDLELLKLFDFGRITPPIVRFEHRHLSVGERDEAVRFLASHGYRMVREEHDTTGYADLSSARRASSQRCENIRS
jgi:FkbM family methyltransferase